MGYLFPSAKKKAIHSWEEWRPFSMKILMVIDRYFPVWGGAENQLRELSRRLLASGCKIIIITRRWKKDMLQYDVIDSIPVVRVGWPGCGQSETLRYILAMTYYLLCEGKKADVIHTHGAAALGAVGSLAAWFTGSRNIAKITTAGRIPKLQKNLLGFLIISLFKRSDAIVCMTSEIRKELEVISTSSHRVIQIPNAVNANRFYPLPDKERQRWRVDRGFGSQDPIVIFSGRFVYRKGIDVLINAWPYVITRYPKARLIILGSGHHQRDSIEEQMRRKVSQESITNIYFIGDTRTPESYLSVGDIFVFPSRREGFPNAILEAMASGLATVASKIGGVTDLIENGKTGLIFPSENYKCLSEKIIYLLDRPVELDSIGKAAREKVLRNFSFKKIVAQYLTVYQTLISN